MFYLLKQKMEQVEYPLLVDFRAESYKDGHTNSFSAHVISILSFPLQTHNILSTSGYLNAEPHQFCTNPTNTCTLLTNPLSLRFAGDFPLIPCLCLALSLLSKDMRDISHPVFSVLSLCQAASASPSS